MCLCGGGVFGLSAKGRHTRARDFPSRLHLIENRVRQIHVRTAAYGVPRVHAHGFLHLNRGRVQIVHLDIIVGLDDVGRQLLDLLRQIFDVRFRFEGTRRCCKGFDETRQVFSLSAPDTEFYRVHGAGRLRSGAEFWLWLRFGLRWSVFRATEAGAAGEILRRGRSSVEAPHCADRDVRARRVHEVDSVLVRSALSRLVVFEEVIFLGRVQSSTEAQYHAA